MSCGTEREAQDHTKWMLLIKGSVQKMKIIENECVSCDLPCMGSACPYQNVTRYYCDRCEEETTLYYYDGEELCVDCLIKEFEIVKGLEE